MLAVSDNWDWSRDCDIVVDIHGLAACRTAIITITGSGITNHKRENIEGV
jgi:hypothetical protein